MKRIPIWSSRCIVTLVPLLILVLAACVEPALPAPPPETPAATVAPVRATVSPDPRAVDSGAADLAFMSPPLTPTPAPLRALAPAYRSETGRAAEPQEDEVGLLTVHFIDVGQGDATLLHGPDFTILIDAGRHDRDDVVPYLQSVGIQHIDLLVGTHPHADHIGQFPQVLAAFSVGEVWMSGDPHTTLTFERVIDAIEASEAGYHEPRAGETETIGSATISVVNPEDITGDLHTGSIGLRITYGEVAFLFTGDAEAETERAMVERGHDLRSHVLQVGHHGSRAASSTEFVEAVQPEIAIYSAGAGNQYGHPHDQAVDRLVDTGAEVYGTDLHGHVIVEADGETYEVRLERGALARAPPDTDTTTSEDPAPGPAVDGCRDDQVDINTASVDMLQRIVHIGPERAGQLVELRPFASVDQLTRIRGIAAARLADIKEQDVACVGS